MVSSPTSQKSGVDPKAVRKQQEAGNKLPLPVH